MEISSQLLCPNPPANTLNNPVSLNTMTHFYGTSENGNYATEIDNSNAIDHEKVRVPEKSIYVSSNMQNHYQDSPGERKIANTPEPERTRFNRENLNFCDSSSQYESTTMFQSSLYSKNMSSQVQNPLSTSECGIAERKKESSVWLHLHQESPATPLEQEKVTTVSETVPDKFNPYSVVKSQSRVLIPPRELKTTDMILNGMKYQKPLNIQTQCQPILYSAIGSLEHYNQFNIGSFDKKIVEAEKLRAVTISKNNQVSSNRGVRKLKNEKATKKIGQALQKSLTQSNRTLSSEGDRSILDKSSSEINVISSISSKHVPKTQGRIEHNSKEKPELQQKKESGIIQTQKSKKTRKSSQGKRVTIDDKVQIEKRPVEMFRPSCDAYTPRMGKKSIKYKPTEERTPMEKMSGTMGSLQRPNFRDALRRVSMIIRQHVVKIEKRFSTDNAQLNEVGLFSTRMRDMFLETNFLTPRYKCNIVKIPMAKGGIVCGMREININYQTPTESEIYEFAHQLFKSVRLSSECSIVCLIYVERLMEVGKVPLLPSTWKPIIMCGLLLASKVWQDLSSWNIEFASVYPQYSPDAINRLEVLFLRTVKWDLYISSSLYAKYYFALRSILEKQDFRHRYNMLVGAAGKVTASQALKIERRTTIIKEEALQHLSKSM